MVWVVFLLLGVFFILFPDELLHVELCGRAAANFGMQSVVK